jgi:hypothetical protein
MLKAVGIATKAMQIGIVLKKVLKRNKTKTHKLAIKKKQLTAVLQLPVKSLSILNRRQIIMQR